MVSKNVRELEKLNNSLGSYMAEWIEQELEWAQRILNGNT